MVRWFVLAPCRPRRARPSLLVPALSTLVMLAALIGLGTWQVERLAWKTALLSQIDHAEAAPAIPLPADPVPFTTVRAEGRLRQDLSVLYGAEGRSPRTGPVMGAHLITPLERPNADPLLVDRGWIPTQNVPSGVRSETVAVEGYVRPAEHAGWFSAADDTLTRHVYTLDPQAIAAIIGLPRVAPFTLVVIGPEGTPDPVRALPRPPNNHLSYAITWYGLTIALLVIFLLHARKVLRS